MGAISIQSGQVTTVTLNRPDVRNAFNEEMIAELTAFADGVPADGSVRAVVLRGAGPVFSAGADVQWMSKMLGYSREENLADAQRAAIGLAQSNSEQIAMRRSQVQANQHAQAAAAAQQAKADVRLGYTEVKAPIDGIVDVRAARPGEDEPLIGEADAD